MAERQQASGRWYPSSHQLKDASATEQAFRRLLEMHYDLVDSHMALQGQVTKPAATEGTEGSPPPPGSGPTDTQILGLRVAPVDAQTLANGATLKWNKTKGQFEFV
jgi:hypothetical protein